MRSLTLKLVFQEITMLWTGADTINPPEEHIAQAVDNMRRRNPSTIEQPPGCECPRLDLLLRSIVENPDLSDHVRTISLQCSHGHPSSSGKSKLFGHKPALPPPPETEEYGNMVLAAVRRTGLDKSTMKEQFETGLKTNQLDTVIIFCWQYEVIKQRCRNVSARRTDLFKMAMDTYLCPGSASHSRLPIQTMRLW
jgi:hypothetical protein